MASVSADVLHLPRVVVGHIEIATARGIVRRATTAEAEVEVQGGTDHQVMEGHQAER